MKICDVTQFFSPLGGGVRRYITEKTLYLKQNTQDQHLLIIPTSETEIVRENPCTIAKIKSPHISQTTKYRILLNLKKTAEYIQQEKPDIIECSDAYHLAWKIIQVGKQFNIPTVGFYHSHFPEAYLRTAVKFGGPWAHKLTMHFAKKYIVKLYNQFDATFVPSKLLAKLLTDWGVKNTIPVSLGIDTNIFYPSQPQQITRKSLGIPEDTFLLLYIGRLAGEKNTRVLLDTFRLLDKKSPGKFSFLVIGDGQLQKQLLRTKKHLPNFHWIPYCKESTELADYYRLSDLFVHPGVCETFGIVVAESQACGCPVVGIKGSYMDAHIHAGHNLWAEQNSPEALAQAVLRFTQADTKQLGTQAAKVAQENYSWDRVFAHIWTAYHQIIAKHKKNSSTE